MEKKISLEMSRERVAKIDGFNCVNCGTCEEYCPVGAIGERQKEVCHLCPDCTEMKALNVQEMYDLRNTSCTLECPLGISPQGYINLLKYGKAKEAFDLIYEKNPLPSVCGYICHHPCEQTCKRGKLVDEPMKIRGLKRYLGEKFLDEEPEPYPVKTDMQIAIIGAGPAGLTAAHTLAKRGYPVTVFEQGTEAGGMLLKGIPEFRLDKNVVRKEIAKIEKAGVTFVYNAKIDHQKAIDELKKEYDAVIVSVGTQISKDLPIEGYRTENVLKAVNLMEKVNSGKEVVLYGDVVVIGGGSVAADVARSALRLGAEKVTMMCLESGEAIPAHPWELEEAEEEGVELISGVSPVRFIGECHKLEGIEYTGIENLDITTFKFDRKEGTRAEIKADFAIIATGQRTDIKIEDPDVILAGDIAGGKCSVIDAMASGRNAAVKADEKLTGRPYEEYKVEREIGPGERQYKVYPAVRLKKNFPQREMIDAAERIHSFDIAEKGLDDDSALLETERCLSCGYRFVDIDKCIGCGTCMKVCPKGNVIALVSEEKSTEE
jgi:NADPH-dependent glutamate synthase beta chain and related oxidoreductases